MNNNPNETEVLEHTEELKEEPVITPVVEESPEITEVKEEHVATAEEIVAQAQSEANKAADEYSKKEAPVAPQQDRIQLIDTKPKLHAVQLGGVTMSTEAKQEVSEHTEVLEPIEVNPADTPEGVPTTATAGSKGATFGIIALFVGLLVMVIFLPDIQEYIENQKYLRNQPKEEKITTGTLNCTLEDSSETLDYDYTFNFSFSNNKLNRLKSITEIRGDVSLDEAELDKLKTECDLLSTVVEDLSGVEVTCKLENGRLRKTQVFNFSSIVVDDAITAFIEAGGNYPFYRNGDDMDKIEKELLGANYSCKREK